MARTKGQRIRRAAARAAARKAGRAGTARAARPLRKSYRVQSKLRQKLVKELKAAAWKVFKKTEELGVMMMAIDALETSQNPLENTLLKNMKKDFKNELRDLRSDQKQVVHIIRKCANEMKHSA